MENQVKILVVEDEDTLCEVLRFNLEAEGYIVDTAHSAEEALTLDISQYSMLLLDIMMGEISGIQLARIIKANPALRDIPVIFCTAKDDETDIVSGLNLGADDYITKPYTIANVIARVKAVLRRTSNRGKVPADTISYEGLILNRSNKTCHIDGEEVKLPKKEFEILKLLLENIGNLFSRECILQKIWDDEVVVVDRVVDVNITRIRQKIGRYGKNIVTRSGYGYGFFPD